MNALDIWVLAIWQVDGYDSRSAWRTLYAVGALTTMRWGRLAMAAADPASPPKSVQLGREGDAGPQMQPEEPEYLGSPELEKFQ